MPPKKMAALPAKKSAKKAAKKGAKKAAKKGAKGPGHHMRRAYEHLHRLQTLARQLGGDDLKAIDMLSQYAQAAFREENAKMAADLLRAAEHLAFASLAGNEGPEVVDDELAEALRSEFEHLLDRAAAEWEALDPSPARALRGIYTAARSGAKAAWKSKLFGEAMEFARGADALAHAGPGHLKLDVASRGEPALLRNSRAAS